MSSDRAPPERPEPPAEAENDMIETERHDPLSSVRMTPGVRRTGNVEMLVVEAELVADGASLDNPARPRTESVGEAFIERIENTELRPAWAVMADRRNTTEADQ